MMNSSKTSSSEIEKPTPSTNLNQVGPGPPTMPPSGYPVQGGYGGYPPCTGYPGPTYNHYAHQTIPPQHMNNAYYSSHFPHIYPEPRRGYSLSRTLLCLVTMLLIIASTMSLLFWAIFGTEIPRFTLESMFVPSFEITNSAFNAVWDVNVTVYNPNKKLKASFDHIEGRLVYKDVLMDVSTVDSILNLESNEGRIMNAKFAVPSPDYGSTGSYWFREIEDDRKKGSVGFSLRFVALATFKSGEFWRRQTPLAIICDDILVQFPAPIGAGTWNGSKKDCFITI